MFPTQEQKASLNEVFSVYNYVYNKTNALIKNKCFSPEKWELIRDHIVTSNTQKHHFEYKEMVSVKQDFMKKLVLLSFPENLKSRIGKILDSNFSQVKKNLEFQENPEVKAFEKTVHKDVRADAVKTCCEMYKSAISNLTNGNIRYYDISYKKKNSPSKCFGGLSKTTTKISNQTISIMPGKLKDLCKFKISKKNYLKYSGVEIAGECKVMMQKGKYFFGLTLATKEKNTHKTGKVCGIDPGLRSFLTIYDNENILEINQNRAYFKALNAKIRALKARRLGTAKKPRIRKRHFNKIEKKKNDYTDAVHWSIISFLIKNYDTILLGDIKSHDIVKKGFNKSNNQEFNDLKFYIFKSRLAYKAALASKKLKLVNEFNTTKCCSNCGNLNNFVGSSEIYNCEKCKLVCGRDSNAAKNILLKGILCL